MPQPRGRIGRWLSEHLDRRIWPVLVTVGFVLIGCLYVFTWSPVVRHRPYLWVVPGDLRSTYDSAAALAFGHFASVYNIGGGGFLAFPGFLVLLLPVAALARTFSAKLIEVGPHNQTIANPTVVHFRSGGLVQLPQSVTPIQGHHFVVQPQWILFTVPYVLALACLALFACDALAERLGVPRNRRFVLVVLEAVLLWNVTVSWGHPEDAVALAFAVYALVFAFDRRLVGAGWLFGAAVACQPLVILMLPILLVIAGWPAAVAMTIRSIAPAAVLTAIPLAANYDATVHAVVKQPTFPLANHQTPWTTFASRVKNGKRFAVSGGPNRVISFVLVCGLAAWARRWRDRPELLAWACALALAIRSFTESVMTPYYVWPALALGVAVAAKASRTRFTAAAALAVATTVVAQWHLAWLPWWCLVMAGLVAVLALSANPGPVEPELSVQPGRFGLWLTDFLDQQKPVPVAARSRPAAGAKQSNKQSKQKRNAARSSRKRQARR